MADAIDARTILLVGSAPCFPYGLVDPIPALGQLALERDLWLHVDACVGGYLNPFAEREGVALPAWDFRVEGVRTIRDGRGVRRADSARRLGGRSRGRGRHPDRAAER